ncbi:kinesin related protein [Striga asiatica]|uniref:Kinesin related protein n=1 Tax=Striga asiatica TaxID=4170 RepID=A0A5A7QM53_STRAF|nr:kinesin related protein [Striga asiatica]
MARPNSRISESGRFLESISSSVPFKSFLPKAKQKPFSNHSTKLRSDENAASVVQEEPPEAPDPPVKVVVRIGPANKLGIGENSVSKVAKTSLCVADRNYGFDSIFESDSTQEDVYHLVGAPLVKDALSGYNTTIMAYGQTGSGKTYTMWGPPNAMVGSPVVNGPQGIVPRIFQKLFSGIQKEQENPDCKMMNYQCRCSFLEVYDEKISDLLDPTQRGLEITDDIKNGFYVEHLSEEYVSCYEDVTQILIKGLSNRKTGTTRINSKSSRSHIMFTCKIESWCKDSSSKCFGISKISRISLVDLAGFERNIHADACRQHVKEGKYINKSTSKIGLLVNILAKESQSGKSEGVPYRSSRLIHLLRESFGGNAKLSIICTVSPDKKSSSETLSTFRFGLLAKLMKNEPVVNEITEDDVNNLSDQIRQLKEELKRAKSSTSNHLSSSNHGYFQGVNLRASLNQLRLSLNNSLILPGEENVSEEKSHINEDDVTELKLQYVALVKTTRSKIPSKEACEKEFTREHYMSCSEGENEEINSSENKTERKSLVFPSNHESDMVGSLKNVDVIRQSQKQERSNKIFAGHNESLAASLHRGLQIIDYHKRNSTPSRSSVSFSFEHLALKPCLKADNANASVQTSDQTSGAIFVCIRCQGKDSNEADKAKGVEKDLVLAIERDTELKSICKDQAAQIEHLNRKLEQSLLHADINKHHELPLELIKEKCEIKEVQNSSICTSSAPPIRRSSSDKLRSSLLSQSMLKRKNSINSKEEFEREREKWMEMES